MIVMVEQGSENPCVGSSILSLATNKNNSMCAIIHLHVVRNFRLGPQFSKRTALNTITWWGLPCPPLANVMLRHNNGLVTELFLGRVDVLRLCLVSAGFSA